MKRPRSARAIPPATQSDTIAQTKSGGSPTDRHSSPFANAARQVYRQRSAAPTASSLPPGLLPPRWCQWPRWLRSDARGTTWRWDPWRVYLWPTPFGWGYLLLLIALFLLAANYQLSLAYLLLFFAAAFGIAAAVATVRHLAGVTLTLMPAAPVFAGEPLHWPIHWHAPETARGSALLVMARPATPQAPPAAVVIPFVTETGEHHLPWPTERRGRCLAPLLVVTTTLPWGLVRAWALWQPPLHAWVYPRPLPDAPPWPDRRFPLTDAASSALYEEHLDPNGVDWHDWRAARPGEVARRLHRHQLARHDELWVAEHAAPAADPSAPLSFQWDDTTGETETRLACLTAWVERAARTHRPFGLTLPHAHLPPGVGEAHRQAALLLLARFGEPPDRAKAEQAAESH